MKIASSIIVLLCASSANAAEDQPPDDALQGVIASARIAGSCSILVQMAKFQSDTQMPGGDEFLSRFYSMETARLGMTPDQYTKMCANAARVVQFYSEGLPGEAEKR